MEVFLIMFGIVYATIIFGRIYIKYEEWKTSEEIRKGLHKEMRKRMEKLADMEEALGNFESAEKLRTLWGILNRKLLEPYNSRVISLSILSLRN